MPITLTITADTPTDFFHQLAGAVGSMRAVGGGGAQQTTQGPPAAAPKGETAKPIDGEIIPPKADTKTTTRKPRETKKADEPKGETAPEPKTETAEAGTVESQVDIPPVDDVRAALKKLASEKGDDAVFGLLKDFKAKNASTVPEDKRAELIAKVAELVGAE